MFKNILYNILALTAVMLSSGCRGARNGDVYTTVEGSVWHTTMRITYSSERDLKDSIIAVTGRVEQSLSPFLPDSRISAINRGENTAIDGYIDRVFTESQRISRLSGGAFDPSVAPLVNLWGFGYAESVGEPCRAQIDSCLSLVGIADCKISDGHIVKKSPGTQFNFSAITKGFGIDCIAEMLRGEGIENYMIEIGGEIALRGVNARGEKWHIQIDAPVDDVAAHEKLSVIEVTDCCIATSGNYRNYRDTSRGRIGHTISPTTGYPYANDVLSATVIAPTAMTADALATALMAMTADDGLKIIENIEATEAMLVVEQSDTLKVVTTSAFPAMAK